MATPTFDSASNSGAQASVSTFNWAHTLGAGSNLCLFVGVTNVTSRTVSSITYGAQNLSAVTGGRATTPGGGGETTWWYLVAPSGNQTITVTLSGSASGAVAGAIVLADVDQVTPFGTAVTANGTSLSPAVNASPSATQLSVGAVLEDTATSNSITTGTGTERWNVNVGTNTIAGAGSTSSTSHSWTLFSPSDEWAAVAVPVNWGTGGGGGGGLALPWLPRVTNLQGDKGATMISSGFIPPNKV
jgi:hypothetical protein